MMENERLNEWRQWLDAGLSINGYQARGQHMEALLKMLADRDDLSVEDAKSYL